MGNTYDDRNWAMTLGLDLDETSGVDLDEYVDLNEAKIVSDSVSPWGNRVTTMECTFPRYVLAEFNTHRVFSRNSASSRAIPIDKRIEAVLDTPYIPEFGTNQRGMQAGSVLTGYAAEAARDTWLEARDKAVEKAGTLASLGVHKQVVNRILEPFQWHTVIVTSTEWQNFFKQRSRHHADKADPAIAVVATLMEDALDASTPVNRQSHTPLIGDQGGHENDLTDIHEWVRGHQPGEAPIGAWVEMVSAARCARVSYLTHDGRRDIGADVKLYQQTLAKYGHWSPMEHVAVADPNCNTGNFVGWRQMRSWVET